MEELKKNLLNLRTILQLMQIKNALDDSSYKLLSESVEHLILLQTKNLIDVNNLVEAAHDVGFNEGYNLSKNTQYIP
jgi:hypothetical protein